MKDKLTARMAIEMYCIQACMNMVEYDTAKKQVLRMKERSDAAGSGQLQGLGSVQEWRRLEGCAQDSLIALKRLGYEVSAIDTIKGD